MSYIVQLTHFFRHFHLHILLLKLLHGPRRLTRVHHFIHRRHSLYNNTIHNVTGGHCTVNISYNLVPAKERWCSAAGKVTVGLASHWSCVTDFSGLSTYGLTDTEREMSTPPTLHIGLWSTLPLPLSLKMQKQYLPTLPQQSQMLHMYYRSETGGRCCIGAGQTLCVNSLGGSTFLPEVSK